jgi:hypothetical protein
MEASPPGSAHPRDDQQARLVESLRAAGGEPVEFEELRAKGIEHPAVVSYELEAAGVPIIQTRDQNRRALALDTRLAEGEQEEQSAHAGHRGAPRAWPTAVRRHAIGLLRRVQHAAERSWPAAGGIRRGASRAAGATRSGARRAVGGVRHGTRLSAHARVPGRAAAVGALVLSAVLVLAIAVAQFDQPSSGRGHEAGHPARHVARPQGASAAQAAQRPTPSVPRAPSVAQTPVAVGLPSTPGPASPAAAAAFEADGHQLMMDGRYRAAIGNFLAAIRASGQTLAACTEPASEPCLTFAYALYDLGRTLRLEGHPSAAVPILSERLRIDNQRAIVEHELELARGPSA